MITCPRCMRPGLCCTCVLFVGRDFAFGTPYYPAVSGPYTPRALQAIGTGVLVGRRTSTFSYKPLKTWNCYADSLCLFNQCYLEGSNHGHGYVRAWQSAEIGLGAR